MPNMYLPEHMSDNQRAALDWWMALDAYTRMVYLEAAWEIEGCPTVADLRPSQRKRERSLESRMRQILRLAVRGKPHSFERLSKLRAEDETLFNKIADEEREYARKALNPLA